VISMKAVSRLAMRLFVGNNHDPQKIRSASVPWERLARQSNLPRMRDGRGSRRC
jgi:hypothetical protein